jgi:hypothetical protein
MHDVGDALLPRDFVAGVGDRAYLDGLGRGSGQQLLRPLIADARRFDLDHHRGRRAASSSTGCRAGMGPLTFHAAVTLRAGAEPVRRPVRRAAPPSSRASPVAERHARTNSPRFASAYGDQPESRRGFVDVGPARVIVLVGVEAWAPPGNVTEDQVARAAARVGQCRVREAGRGRTSRRGHPCGWHYHPDDPPAPATPSPGPAGRSRSWSASASG